MKDDLAFDLRGFIDTSLLEWENNVATVVIAGGCNLRCPYCHSWRYVTGLQDLERLDPQIVFDLLQRQRGWIDGVVFTGGEPTLQPGLEKMIRRCRGYDVKIKLHTNGTRPEVVESLLAEELLDCIALDYKAPFGSRFYDTAGIPAEPENLSAVMSTFAMAADSGIEREYHTTLAPAFVNSESLTDMAEALEPEGLWILQQFESGDCLDPVAAGQTRYSNAELDSLESIARQRHARVLLKRGTSG